jgi:hypothetical protein
MRQMGGTCPAQTPGGQDLGLPRRRRHVPHLRHDHHVELIAVSTARALQFSLCSTGGMQRGLFVDCGRAGDANHFIL